MLETLVIFQSYALGFTEVSTNIYKILLDAKEFISYYLYTPLMNIDIMKFTSSLCFSVPHFFRPFFH